jgi:isopenicillin-N epimerase
VNAVLRSFPLTPGDEILISELAYGGVMNAARFAARDRGASVIVVPAPDVATADSLADSFEAAVTAQTRIAIVDHISAQSALIWPVAELAARLRRRGVAVLCDGAHVPGALKLDVPSLGVDWYVANLHKSAFVPRSSAFLWATRERQAGLHPTVISWGLDQGFTMEFDLVGTRDASAHLAASAAFAFIDSVGGLDAILEHNHALVWQGARLLVERCGATLDAREALVGTMATVTLPSAFGTTADAAMTLRDELLFDENIEVAVHVWRGRVQMRVAAQIYNDLGDFERLAAAVAARAGRSLATAAGL